MATHMRRLMEGDRLSPYVSPTPYVDGIETISRLFSRYRPIEALGRLGIRLDESKRCEAALMAYAKGALVTSLSLSTVERIIQTLMTSLRQIITGWSFKNF